MVLKMAEKLEDLNLPNTVVTRLIKDVIPENCTISKEAKIAIAKAASVFVLFLTSASNHSAVSHNRKTINALDVIEGIKSTNFDSFVEPLQEALEVYKKTIKQKKDASAKKKKEKGNQDGMDTSENVADVAENEECLDD